MVFEIKKKPIPTPLLLRILRVASNNFDVLSDETKNIGAIGVLESSRTISKPPLNQHTKDRAYTRALHPKGKGRIRLQT